MLHHPLNGIPEEIRGLKTEQREKDMLGIYNSPKGNAQEGGK